jgi:addiction module HigA family antidote
MGISQTKFAHELDIPIQRVNTLINGKRGITAETALLIARALKTTPEFWMNLQAACDLHAAQRELAAA